MKTTTINTIVWIMIISLFASSCNKFVEIEEISGTRPLKYTSDYQYLLNNSTTFEKSYGFPLISCDDAGVENATQQNTLTNQWALTYTWDETRYSETEEDIDWSNLYNQINICNQITDGVLDSQGGSMAVKEYILAQAKTQRAYAYLMLANMYAKPYNPSTASTDLGLPLLTTSYLFSSLERVSLDQVYQQIINDLKSSLPDLPDLPDFNCEPSKAAAYAILAETYLMMRDFTKAGLYADSVLMIQNTLIDLNSYISNPSTLPKKLMDPEIILSKTVPGSYYPNLTLSRDFLQFIGEQDLRYVLFTAPHNSGYGRYYSRYQYTYEGVYTGPNVPEMMLIKAESEAREGDYLSAVNILNTLRKKRFKPAEYADLSASSASEALTLVINERRRELFGRGFRWFDMRRLNYDQAFARSYTRTFKDQTYTLDANSNRFTYAIAEKYILLNPEIEQNPR
ncbi:MAG: RagB/SusD family nutrient uptake outer membrane protein [Bacteroidales bacterium]|nr:RagB/SusD family nutrient uptake outer membrane protein [Bacteroidales bacterium]